MGVIGGKCAGRNCDSPLDRAGHHATTCPKGGDLYRRHNGLRDLIGRLLSEGGAAWAKEQGPSTDRTRPADILVPVWEQGSAVALNVTVVSPLNLDVVRQAGLTSGLEVGAPAAAAAALKHTAGDAACRELQWNLRALVANEYGGWGSEAEKFFKVHNRCQECPLCEARSPDCPLHWTGAAEAGGVRGRWYWTGSVYSNQSPPAAREAMGAVRVNACATELDHAERELAEMFVGGEVAAPEPSTHQHLHSRKLDEKAL